MGCQYCGKETDGKFCSRECYSLSSRKVGGYIGTYLMVKDATYSKFTGFAKAYLDLSPKSIYNKIVQGVPLDNLSDRAELQALKLSCAAHDIDPQMEVAPGVVFDYRMIINEPNGSLRDPLKTLTEMIYEVGMKPKTFILHVDDLSRLKGGENVEWAKKIIAAGERGYDQLDLDKVFGDKKWHVHYRFALKKKFGMTAKLAFAIAGLLGFMSEPFDYRYLLPEVRPQDYITGIKTRCRK